MSYWATSCLQSDLWRHLASGTRDGPVAWHPPRAAVQFRGCAHRRLVVLWKRVAGLGSVAFFDCSITLVGHASVCQLC